MGSNNNEEDPAKKAEVEMMRQELAEKKAQKQEMKDQIEFAKEMAPLMDKLNGLEQQNQLANLGGADGNIGGGQFNSAQLPGPVASGSQQTLNSPSSLSSSSKATTASIGTTTSLGKVG